MAAEDVATGFAQDVVPEAFERPTAASRVGLTLALAEGPLAWEAWLEEAIDRALGASSRDGHFPSGVALVDDGRLCWRFHDPGCAHMECMLFRPRDELHDHVRLPWLFVAWLGRPEPRWVQHFDEDGNEIDEVLTHPQRQPWSMRWYGEARGRGVASVDAGRVDMFGGYEPGREVRRVRLDRTDAWLGGAPDLLRGHPARRSHRLRRH